jgi:hypothetical protein
MRSPSGCANDPGAEEWGCSACNESGHVELDSDSDEAEGLRPWTPTRRRWLGHLYSHVKPYDPADDVLVSLAHFRVTGAKGKSVSYANTKRRAMQLVDLPPDDVHLLVTPETAAYFNDLERARRACGSKS